MNKEKTKVDILETLRLILSDDIAERGKVVEKENALLGLLGRGVVGQAVRTDGEA